MRSPGHCDRAFQGRTGAVFSKRTRGCATSPDPVVGMAELIIEAELTMAGRVDEALDRVSTVERPDLGPIADLGKYKTLDQRLKLLVERSGVECYDDLPIRALYMEIGGLQGENDGLSRPREAAYSLRPVNVFNRTSFLPKIEIRYLRLNRLYRRSL